MIIRKTKVKYKLKATVRDYVVKIKKNISFYEYMARIDDKSKPIRKKIYIMKNAVKEQ